MGTKVPSKGQTSQWPAPCDQALLLKFPPPPRSAIGGPSLGCLWGTLQVQPRQVLSCGSRAVGPAGQLLLLLLPPVPFAALLLWSAPAVTIVCLLFLFPAGNDFSRTKLTWLSLHNSCLASVLRQEGVTAQCDHDTAARVHPRACATLLCSHNSLSLALCLSSRWW